jgi:hypothetical protein
MDRIAYLVTAYTILVLVLLSYILDRHGFDLLKTCRKCGQKWGVYRKSNGFGDLKISCKFCEAIAAEKQKQNEWEREKQKLKEEIFKKYNIT